MELPVLLQGKQFLLSLLLGLGYGLLYDLFRGLRRNLPSLTVPVDLVFALAVLLGNLLFALYVGRGAYRIFFLFGQSVGCGLWFLILSKAALWTSTKIWEILIYPFKMIFALLGKFFKKSKKILKKTFSNRKKSVTIKGQ